MDIVLSLHLLPPVPARARFYDHQRGSCVNDVQEDILQATLSGLEAGLLVRHIAAFDLKTCDVDDEMTKVLLDPVLGDFDQIPVKKNDQIVGVVERKEEGISGPVKENMRPLDESILVSAEMPLIKFIHLAAGTPCRLVLKGAKIQGIVTPSDIPKLPVRLFAFALVTHLEMVMANVIRAKCPNEQDWLAFLSVGRRKKLEKKSHDLKRKNLNLSMLELTEFCDKRTTVKKVCKLSNKFESELKEIEKLRNKVAHAGNYAQNEEEVRSFVELLRQAEHWINQLSEGMRSSPKG